MWHDQWLTSYGRPCLSADTITVISKMWNPREQCWTLAPESVIHELYGSHALHVGLSLLQGGDIGLLDKGSGAGVKEYKVTAITGKEIAIQGDTLCVHGDGAKALAFVERIRKEFEAEGIAIRNFL